MELNRSNCRRIVLIIMISIFFFWILNNTVTFVNVIRSSFRILTPFVIGLCFAFVVNVILRPIEKAWVKLGGRRTRAFFARIKRPVCLLISILLILSVLFVVAFMLLPQIQDTLETTFINLPAYRDNLENWYGELKTTLAEKSIVLPELSLDFLEVGEMLADFLYNSGSMIFDRVWNMTSSIFSGVFDLVLGIAFACFFLSGKEKLCAQFQKILYAYLPIEKTEQILQIASLSNKTFTRFVTGQLTEAVIIGFLCLAGMLVFAMPYALMISVLVGFTALIPVFGAFFGTAVGAFFILLDDPIKAIWFIVFIIVLQQLEGNIIYPRVVGKSVGLPGIWVLTAVTLGGSIFGIPGMLVSVPIASILYSLISTDVSIRLNERKSKK